MAIFNTQNSYGNVAKGLHWLMALLIIGMLIIGFVMINLPITPDKFKLYGWHKSIGVTILLLALLRIMWRSVNHAPSLPERMKKREQYAAKAGHVLLYALMVAMPISGWAMSSAAGKAVSVFGLFLLPDLVTPESSLRELFQQMHFYLAWTLIAVISGHVLAALTHHFYFKDNVLKRMLPFGKDA